MTEKNLYRKAGAGNPCAGQRIDKVSFFNTIIGRVSIEDNLGEVADIGSRREQISSYLSGIGHPSSIQQLRHLSEI